MNIDKFNSEGYYDPTTYEAFTDVYCEETAVDKKAPVYHQCIFAALCR